MILLWVALFTSAQTFVSVPVSTFNLAWAHNINKYVPPSKETTE